MKTAGQPFGFWHDWLFFFSQEQFVHILTTIRSIMTKTALRTLLLLISLLPSNCGAVPTEAEIVAREIAWVKQAVQHYRYGFRLEHPLNWSIEQELDPTSFGMPEHHPIMEASRQKFKLRGSPVPWKKLVGFSGRKCRRELHSWRWEPNATGQNFSFTPSQRLLQWGVSVRVAWEQPNAVDYVTWVVCYTCFTTYGHRHGTLYCT